MGHASFWSAVIGLLLMGSASPVAAQSGPSAFAAVSSPDPEVGSLPRKPAEPAIDLSLSVHYTTARDVVVLTQPDSGLAYVSLGLREPVYLLSRGESWSKISTLDGARGFVRNGQISNVWLRVAKEKRSVFVYRGSELVRAIPADLSYNFFSDKERRGTRYEPDHWRTPEGTFYIVNKNAASRFYKALVLNYPNAESAERGLARGQISNRERDAIVEADRRMEMPPMNTSLGGWIEIHGDGTGVRANWTQGCVAVPNPDIDWLWSLVSVGTPVVIER